MLIMKNNTNNELCCEDDRSCFKTGVFNPARCCMEGSHVSGAQNRVGPGDGVHDSTEQSDNNDNGDPRTATFHMDAEPPLTTRFVNYRANKVTSSDASKHESFRVPSAQANIVQVTNVESNLESVSRREASEVTLKTRQNIKSAISGLDRMLPSPYDGEAVRNAIPGYVSLFYCRLGD